MNPGDCALPEIPAAGAWVHQAACSGHENPEWWFPGQGESYRAAAEVCASCLVRVECLDYAVANNIPHGIWGGLSERGRRPLRLAFVASRPAHGVPARYAAGCHCPECREAHRLQSAKYRAAARRRGDPLTAAQNALTAR